MQKSCDGVVISLKKENKLNKLKKKRKQKLLTENYCLTLQKRLKNNFYFKDVSRSLRIFLKSLLPCFNTALHQKPFTMLAFSLLSILIIKSYCWLNCYFSSEAEGVCVLMAVRFLSLCSGGVLKPALTPAFAYITKWQRLCALQMEEVALWLFINDLYV